MKTLVNFDIFAISEHWLFSEVYHNIDNFSSPDILSRKRAFAGVGLLWKASFSDLISPLSIDSDKIVGIQYECPNGDYLFFLALYFPSSYHSMEEFRETLDLLWVIMQGMVTIMGDFNRHLGHLCGGRSTSNPDNRRKLIHDFLNQAPHQLMPFSVIKYLDSRTYQCYAILH